jgi:predicted RNA binding protein YcfA (HicA-like mRNA interferase family)
MKFISFKEFVRILKENGWEENRINGSHYIFTKIGMGKTISIPRKKNVCQPMIKRLLKEAMIV